MANEVKGYLVKAYALLVKTGKRELESLSPAYRIAVAEYLAEQVED